MGDLWSDMEKDRSADRKAIRWAAKRVLETLRARPRGLSRHTIIDRMDQSEPPEAWLWAGFEGKVYYVREALSQLIDENRVRAEPDDHTSIYILENPLDSIAKSL